MTDKFKSNFNVLIDALQIYNDTLKIGWKLLQVIMAQNFILFKYSKIFRRNLLALNIFIREMSIEEMTQRKSYDFWSLLSNLFEISLVEVFSKFLLGPFESVT